MQSVRKPAEKIVFGGKEFFHQPSMQGRDDEMDQMLHALTRRKVFFVTKGGKLATTRGPVAEGDEIHCVEGCGFALLLRRAGRGASEGATSNIQGRGEGGKQRENEFLDLQQCTHDKGRCGALRK